MKNMAGWMCRLFLISATLCSFLLSCATYDPKTGTYTSDSKPIKDGGSDPLLGAVGVVSGLIQISKQGQGKATSMGISGKCRVKKSAKVAGSSCTNAYLVAQNLKNKNTMTVWLTDSGEFFLSAQDGEEFSLYAVNEATLAKSEAINVKSPQIVNIEIVGQ